jgi:hypothetical protein
MPRRNRRDRRAAQGKLLMEANRRPPSVVDVSRAATAGHTPAHGGSRHSEVCAATGGTRYPATPHPQPEKPELLSNCIPMLTT